MLTKFPNLWTHSGMDSKAKSSCSGLILNINFGIALWPPKWTHMPWMVYVLYLTSPVTSKAVLFSFQKAA